MQLPIVSPAPIVATHAQAFRDLFSDHRQYENFEHYLTGLMVLENKTLTNISRCILESADKTNLSRFMSESPWRPEAVNQRRLEYMMSQTEAIRVGAEDSDLIFDDTLCTHVGSLFEYVDRHYDHCDGRYPLAHNLVTSHYLSGAVRIPVHYQVYRRYESVTEWESTLLAHFPDETIPKTAKAKAKLHKKYDSILMSDPKFKALHEQFRSKIMIAKMLLKQAIDSHIPFTTVLMDSWYLSPDLIQALKDYHKDWVSLLKRNRNLDTQSFQLKDTLGQPIQFSQDQIKVEDLVPLIPKSAYQTVEIDQKHYYCFTLCVRLAGLGKVRLVISFEREDLTGTYAVLISNRTNWSARQIIMRYLRRWTIETFYRDSKQYLGLDEYRTRSFSAVDAHWCLVFVAYSILHLDCLPPSSVIGKQGKRPRLPKQSIGEVCRQQGQALIQSLILLAHDRLQEGVAAAQVFGDLFAKQQKVKVT
jgi:SRSO17 transposase